LRLRGQAGSPLMAVEHAVFFSVEDPPCLVPAAQSCYSPPISITQVFAAPKIEVDRSTFDCAGPGPLKGKRTRSTLTSQLKNTGDALLEIENVRPGCGCTVVKFDTVVAPGKSGVIRSTVNLAGFTRDRFSKFVTVISNAANKRLPAADDHRNAQTCDRASEDYISLAQRVPHTVVFACTQRTFESRRWGFPLRLLHPQPHFGNRTFRCLFNTNGFHRFDPRQRNEGL